MSSGSRTPTEKGAPAESTAFVLCIERNEIADQALLLIDSLRTFGGRFAACPIYAVAPRAGMGIDAPTRERLERFDVTYHEEPLNILSVESASANRVYAAAWAARVSSAETMVVLDSDTLFLGEPEALGAEWDVAARPVDLKGSATRGAGDPFEAYWSELCGLAGASIDALPNVETVIDRERVRASYNGGYSVVRRESGILERAAELFTRAQLCGLRPETAADGHAIFAPLGSVGAESSRHWGSSQAVLSVAAWASTRRVRVLDRRFNVPLTCLVDPARWSDDWLGVGPVHVHYAWLMRPEFRALALRTLERLGVPADRREWIEATAAARPRWRARRTPVAASASRPLVICGMHRSGTSLVASVLRRAGLDVGSELLGVGPGNWRGHFEDRGFWHLHEDMLAAVGTTALAAGADFVAPADPLFERRARELVAERSGLPSWGWKDPRTCLFLDFWDDLLPQANFLFLYRHPLDVVLSLRRRAAELRERFDPWSGIRAWEVYNRRILAFSEKYPERSLLAEVPALILDLPGFVARVARTFALELRADGADALFARGELRGRAPAVELERLWTAIAPDAEALFRRLQERASIGAGATGEAAATDASDGEDEQVALFAELFASQALTEREASARRVRHMQAELVSSLRETAELRRCLTVAESRYESAAARRDELSETLTTIERSRTFGIVAAWWWLTGRFRRPTGSGPSR